MSLPNYPSTPTDGQEYTLPSGVIMKWDATTGVWRALANADASFRSEIAAVDSTVLVGGAQAKDLTLMARTALKGEPTAQTTVIAGTIRNMGSIGSPDWRFIVDSSHQCDMNLKSASISVDANGKIVINFGRTFGKIVSFVVAPDETMARQGYTCGASVGRSSVVIDVGCRMTGRVNTLTAAVTPHPQWSSLINGELESEGVVRINHPTNSAFQSMICNREPATASALNSFTIQDINSTVARIYPYRSLNAYITYDGANFQVASSSVTGVSVSFSAGVLTVNHPAGSASIPPIVQTRYNNSVIAMVDSFGASSFTVRFVDFAGNAVTTPNTSMRLSFSKAELHKVGAATSGDVLFDLGYGQVDANNLAVAGGNLWFVGVFQDAL